MSHICISPKCERCAQEIATLRKEKAEMVKVLNLAFSYFEPKIKAVHDGTNVVVNDEFAIAKRIDDVLAKVSGMK